MAGGYRKRVKRRREIIKKFLNYTLQDKKKWYGVSPEGFVLGSFRQYCWSIAAVSVIQTGVLYYAIF